MAEMNRNLLSSILLDEGYIRFADVLINSANRIRRNAEEASGMLLDEPSKETISLILQLCDKMTRLVDDSQESVKSHLKKARETLEAYNTLL